MEDKKDKKEEKKTLSEENVKEKVLKAINEIQPSSLRAKAYALSTMTDIFRETEKKIDAEKKELAKRSSKETLENFQKVRDIIKGITTNLALDDESIKQYNLATEQESPSTSQSPEPIKYFWRIVLVNSHFFEINEKDKEVLNYLSDIQINVDEENFPNYKIEFYFDKNDYFQHEVLTKEFIYEKDSLDEVKEVKGTDIVWSSDEKNPTKKFQVKVIKKKKVRETITKEKTVDSFFDIFDPSKPTKGKLGMDMTEQANYFKNDLVPNCLEYFLDIMDIDYEELSSEEDEEDDE